MAAGGTGVAENVGPEGDCAAVAADAVGRHLSNVGYKCWVPARELRSALDVKSSQGACRLPIGL